MSMWKIAVTAGMLLILQGLGFYLATGAKSPTALIPAGVGLPILLSGFVAMRDSLRMHAMHVAALMGCLGLAAAGYRLATAGLHFTAAGTSLVLMLILCGAFLALCVKSFVDARIRRRAAS